ncbi:hypothetical protein BKA66DRAFT_557395 [Pyrenochaeta sp. MPI-SDFR-AT-0127]|nr:hypothetical protein BKA66DRAFT_557395 [Pyrenochaeta sp. MPI-SDFR-AT-0127]
MGDVDQTCAKCKKTAAESQVSSLKNCARCKVTLYCNRECQKDDWKVHKKICASQANARGAYVGPETVHSSDSSATRLKNLEKHVPNPFTRLDQGKYLHDRPETDVYKLLIDSFRMREADDFNFESKAMAGSVYTGAESSIEPFRHYLAKAAAMPNILPSWWISQKQKECEAFSESGIWNDVRRKISKQEVIDHYGDEKAPMQVRMFAEAVYGVGSMGQSGEGMRKLMSDMEQGGSENGHYSMLDINPFARGQ